LYRANLKINLLFLLLCFSATGVSFAQPYPVELTVHNQSQNTIVLGKIKGDKFTPVDTFHIQKNSSGTQIKKYSFTLPESGAPLMCRIILGQTTYARVMNKPPQQFDFIFNNENVKIKTSFKFPDDSLVVSESEENRVWYSFLHNEKRYQNQLAELKMEIDYYQQKENIDVKQDSLLNGCINRYNNLQHERDSLIRNLVKTNAGMFAAQLIKMYREPFFDGNLPLQQRNEIFKNNYFEGLDFSNEAVINTPIYTQRVFKYLSGAKMQGATKELIEQQFMTDVDIILANAGSNAAVHDFILDYLVRGFEKLHLDNVITYIAENYTETTCETNEKSTLKRKLEWQKMKPGDPVPDFVLNDINGDPVQLSQVVKKQNLILFWASWCPHCTMLIPEIKQWQNQLKNNNFEIIAISLDDSETEWKKQVFKMGTESWYNLSDLKKWDGKVATDYNIYATPTMFLIDENLKIIAKPISFAELQALF
jgi:peroxiredoxin